MISLSQQEFLLLADYVYKYYGIDLKQKKHLIASRLHSHLVEEGFVSFTAFYKHLLQDASGETITAMLDRITTNHTYFMRERQHFDFFKDQVLPELQSKVKNRDLRIWSAGCSSGEEAYTLAMIINDFFGLQQGAWDTRILATDISARALQKARRGVYTVGEIKVLPASWKLDYFRVIDRNSARIVDKIKRQVIFRRFNLMEKRYPFKQQFHVIFCRNVMIYFDALTRRELVQRFYDFIVDGGYLFIGQAESIKRDHDRFRYVTTAVYRKE